MTLTDDQEEKLQFLLTEITNAEGRLSQWERIFVADQQQRYDTYGSEMSLSPKQWIILRKLYERVTE